MQMQHNVLPQELQEQLQWLVLLVKLHWLMDNVKHVQQANQFLLMELSVLQ